MHRDLKPDNVILTRGRGGIDLVKVIDFGIAKAMDATGQAMTQPGFVVGTPGYMSPEQLMAEPVDGRSDLYSLGCIMYKMLAAESPFGDTASAQLSRRLAGPPPSLHARNPQVSEALEWAVTRNLAWAPGDRFQSATEFRDFLVEMAPTIDEKIMLGSPWPLLTTTDLGVVAPPAAVNPPIVEPVQLDAPPIEHVVHVEEPVVTPVVDLATTHRTRRRIVVRAGAFVTVAAATAFAMTWRSTQKNSPVPSTTPPSIDVPLPASQLPDTPVVQKPQAPIAPQPIAKPVRKTEDARPKTATTPTTKADTTPKAEPQGTAPLVAPTFSVAARREIQRVDSLIRSGNRETLRRLLGAEETDNIWQRVTTQNDVSASAKLIAAYASDSSADIFVTIEDRQSRRVLYSAGYKATFAPVPGGLKVWSVTRERR